MALTSPILKLDQARVPLSWTASGVSRQELWDGAKFLRTMSGTTRSCVTDPLSAGEHKLRVVGYDSVGNYKNSNVLTVNIPGVAPVPAPTPVPDPAPAPAPVPAPTTIDSRYKTLVLDEQWTNGIDPARWSIYTTVGDHATEPGVRAASAWTVENGVLVCTAKNQADGQIVTGGMSHRFNAKGGRWEVRAKTDVDVTGTMSGVCLLWPQSSQRRSDGEIDFYETTNKVSRRPLYSFVHYGGAVGDFQTYEDYDVDASQWHTMAVDWDPDTAIRFYLDGQLVWTVTDKSKMPIMADHLCLQFDAFARRTLSGPLRMYIDYVKVWQ